MEAEMKLKMAILLFTVGICGSLTMCGRDGDFPIKQETEVMESGSGGAVSADEIPTGVDAVCEEDASLTPEFAALKNGDTKTLVGFDFGDAFDYDLLDINGSSGDIIEYRLKETENTNLFYRFEGEGHRFSGFSIWWGKGTYFGINFGEDTLDVLTDAFGEPDFYGEQKDWNAGKVAEWYFEKATLSVREKDGKIYMLLYTAAEGVADAQDSAQSETELKADLKDGCDGGEIIYVWSQDEKDCCYDTVPNPFDEEDVGYSEEQIEELEEVYLQEQGFGGQDPAGTLYRQDGAPFMEYYVNEDEQRYCFVMRLWNFDEGGDRHLRAVYCAARSLADAEETGAILYRFDDSQGVTRERLYDEWGMKRAEVSYRYRDGIVFPFITESWNPDDGYYLCRGQMTLFYEELSEFDEQGRFVGTMEVTPETDLRSYLPYACKCVYSQDGRLTAIQEEMQQEDIENDWGWWDETIDYSGQIKLDYYEDGALKSIDYFRSQRSHGTWESNGNIECDRQGRMIYDSYYVTHGGHVSVYLYREEEERPWAQLDWCSFENGFECITLFEPISETEKF